ncbi:ABC transporter permease [Frondihabitans cladoniiphilus]|uniref:ABC transporter permease n=1 Tax=Frondihabitans cladoniiphilus TaxID=715785 RepID=A0ABP8W338_9MICO
MHVARFITRRLIQGVVTVFGVLTVTFFLVRLSGNPAALLLGPEASQQAIAALSHTLGFDQPLIVQYGKFLGGVVTGNMGNSLAQNLPAMGLVLQRLPNTLELALSSFVLGLVLAFVVVLLLQLSGSSRLRNAILWFASARQAIPSFWLGLVLVLVFAVQLKLLPSIGNQSIKSLVLPAFTSATLELALYIRLLDGGFGDQLRQDYVRTAYAKGQTRTKVIVRHMLPNAVLPIITVAGLNLGSLLGGTIVVELVFAWPGVGQLLINSISSRDYTLVQAAILVIALFFVIVNFLVDLLYSVLDPRVRLQ